MTRLTARLGLHYAWVVAAATFVVLLVAAGMTMAPSVLIIPLETEFGWDRPTISSAISILVLLLGLSGPVAGRILDTWGARRVMLVSLSLSALGAGGSAFMSTPLHLQLLWGVVVGLAIGMTGIVMGATVATRWFIGRRGLVVGILSGASSAGQLVFLPLLMSTIVQFGWRPAVLLLAAAAAAMIPLVLWLIKDDPADVGLTAYGAVGPTAGPATSASADSGMPFVDVLKRPAFWLLAWTFFTCGATTIGLVRTHLVPHWIESGIPEITAANVYALMGFMNFVGTTASGWLSDRFNKRHLLAFYYGFRGLALLFLPFVSGPVDMVVFGIVYGLDWVATVPPSVGLCGELFGKRSVGVTFGTLSMIHQFGAALAAYAAAVSRDAAGDYSMAFFAGGAMAITASLVALCIPRVRPTPTPPAVPEPATVA